MMLFGFFLVTASNRMDQVGQGIASVFTLVLLSMLFMSRRPNVQPREFGVRPDVALR